MEILEHDGSSLQLLPKDTVANGDKLHLTVGSETTLGIILHQRRRILRNVF